jgi:hypothetical protein
MKFKIGLYWLSMIAFLALSSCRNNFEWININPEKIQLARKYQPVKVSKVNTVSIKIDLKEKNNEIYYEESTGFFAEEEQKLNNLATAKENITEPVNNKKTSSSKSSATNFNKAKAAIPNKITPNQTTPKKVSEIPKIKETTSEDKLNGALILPQKPSINKNSGEVKKTTNPKAASELRSKAFEDIKKQNPELESKQAEKAKRGQYLMIGGLILTVFGIVMGIVFGKSAYIISIVGVVFAAIGAAMKYYLG